MRKYRIKEFKQKNGKSRFVPQYHDTDDLDYPISWHKLTRNDILLDTYADALALIKLDKEKNSPVIEEIIHKID